MGGSTSKEESPNAAERYTAPKAVVEDDYSKPLPAREKLPDALQKLVDNEESLWDTVREGQ